jgi:exonuclease 3'-5' domain-containing protein 1
MESATRKTTASRKLLNGLAKCVENHLLMPFGSIELRSWKLAKKKGEQLFKPEQGGSYAVFNQRPIPKDIIHYCVGDVQYLPELRDSFCTQRAYRRDLVVEESKKRVAESQRSDYQPHGPDRAMAPWSKEQNTVLDQLHYVPSSGNFSDAFFDVYDDDEEEEDGNDNWYDDYPTSCRDIINDCDYDYYYSD